MTRFYLLQNESGELTEYEAAQRAGEQVLKGRGYALVLRVTDNEDGSKSYDYKLYLPPRGPEIRPKGGRE